MIDLGTNSNMTDLTVYMGCLEDTKVMSLKVTLVCGRWCHCLGGSLWFMLLIVSCQFTHGKLEDV